MPRSPRSNRATGWSPRSSCRAGIASWATRSSSASARQPRSATGHTGAAFLGFFKLYGEVPVGHAEYLRVSMAQTTHQGARRPPDDRSVFLSAVCRRLPVGALRRVTDGGRGRRAPSRPGRRHGGPDRPAPRLPGDRGRSRPRAWPGLRTAAMRPSTSPTTRRISVTSSATCTDG